MSSGGRLYLFIFFQNPNHFGFFHTGNVGNQRYRKAIGVGVEYHFDFAFDLAFFNAFFNAFFEALFYTFSSAFLDELIVR